MLRFPCLPLLGAPGEWPRLETPLGRPQSRYHKVCWAPREKQPKSRGISAVFRATSLCRHIQRSRNIISKQSSSPPSQGGCSRGTCVCTHTQDNFTWDFGGRIVREAPVRLVRVSQVVRLPGFGFVFPPGTRGSLSHPGKRKRNADKLKYKTEYDEIRVIFTLRSGYAWEQIWLVDKNLPNILCWGVLKMDLAQGLGLFLLRGPHAPGFAAEVAQAAQTSRGHSCCSWKAHAWQVPPSSS